jgi:hypothetical protein
MSSAPVSCRQFVTTSVLLISWILLVSLVLKDLFGARVTGGWLIIGAMFSSLLFGTAVMMRELKDALGISVRCPHSGQILQPGDQGYGDKTWNKRSCKPTGDSIDPWFAAPRREALGLSPGFAFANRRRSARRA